LSALACGESSQAKTGGSAGAGGSGTTGDLPCDVDRVLAQNCRNCHGESPKYGAPMPLVTHADLTAPSKSAPGKKVYQHVGERIHYGDDPMPPPPNEPLSTEDRAVLDAWIAQGAPKGDEACDGTGGTDGEMPLGCEPDIQLEPAAPYAMPQDLEDIYICYGVDIQTNSKRHAYTLAPRIDNATIVHHILLFQSDKPYDPTPAPCGDISKGRLMGVWAPGGEPMKLPPEAGFPLEGTAHFVMQVHYSNLMHLAGQKDSSGYQICSTEDLRPNDADILAFGTYNINVPAHGKSDVTCDFVSPAGAATYTALAGMPHMHQMGRKISTLLHPADGSAPIDLGTADPWNFESQAWTTLDKVPVKAGDKVQTRCAWENPSDKDAHFGEKTSDEMCFGFVMYYPRIVSDSWNWGLPALVSPCVPTPAE
jgi:hypothetical protein